MVGLIRDLTVRFGALQAQLNETQHQVNSVIERQENVFSQRLEELAGFSTTSLDMERPNPPSALNIVVGSERQRNVEEVRRASLSRPPSDGETDHRSQQQPGGSQLDGLVPPHRSSNLSLNDLPSHADPVVESTRQVLNDHTFLIGQLRRELAQLADQRSMPHEVVRNPSPPPLKLMYYDGSFPWEQYKVHLETAIQANGWDDDTACIQLIGRLRGDALRVVSILDAATRRNFNLLLGVLATSFGDKRDDNAVRSELRRRMQKPGEDLETFAREIEYLTRRAYPSWPSDIVEKLALEQYMNGIMDAETQLHVRTFSPPNIKTACRIGRKFILDRTATRANQRSLRTSTARIDHDRHQSAISPRPQSPSSPQAASSFEANKPSGNGSGST